MALHQVFDKAAAAKPCTVFFDEFDAIAPKRGHDSTGVTDRVVNQLLCQLDGVEDRSGIFVVAATSRPDLIDAALLRPGRLDKLVRCDFPSARERADILAKLSRGCDVHPEVDLPELATRCEGLTAADLAGLMATAHLKAVHAALAAAAPAAQRDSAPAATEPHFANMDGWEERKAAALRRDVARLSARLGAQQPPDEDAGDAPVEVVVRAAHLEAARAETRPSLSAQDAAFYQDVYNAFSRPNAKQSAGKRTTLA